MLGPHTLQRLAEAYRGPASLLGRPLQESLARELLGGIGGSRLRHVEAVVRLAHECIGKLRIEGSEEARDLLLAAWFHDAAYTPVLQQYGFHPLDGAIFLAAAQASPAVVEAVLFHTGAKGEAASHPGAEFYNGLEEPTGPIYEVLTYCDLQTSPTGQKITIAERIADIERRYGEGHPVTNNIRSQSPSFYALAGRVEGKIVCGSI